MADNFVVQTVYTVADKASAVISSISARVAGLNATLSKSVTGVSDLGNKIGSAFSGITRSSAQPRSALGQFVARNEALGISFGSLRGAATSALGGISASVSSLGGHLFSLPAAIATIGFGALAAGAAKLGDEFEGTQLRIAGFLTALGRTKDIDQGLTVAADTMERIRVAAAILPGEAQEYLEVFQIGLPVINSALGGTMAEMTDFSNKYTAITNILGVESAQAARDMNSMLQAGDGRVTKTTKSFGRMLTFMRQVDGQAKVTTTSFNAMTAHERAALLTATMAKMQPMLEKAKFTFDAMKGSAISNVKHITRLATMPLFEGMKSGLGSFNNLLSDEQGQLTAFGNGIVGIGRFFSEGIVSGIKAAAAVAKDLYGWFEKIWNSPGAQAIFGKLAGAAGAIGQAASGLVSGGGAMSAAASGMAIAGNPLAMLSAPAIIFAGILGELASRGDVVEGVLTFLADSISLLATIVGPLVGFLHGLSVVGADLLQGALAGLLPAILMVAEPIILVGGYLFAMGATLMTKLRPAALMLGQAIGGLFRSVGEFLNPVLRIAGTFLIRLYGAVQQYLLPVFNVLVSIVSGVITGFSQLLSWIGKWIGKAADAYEAEAGISLKQKESATPSMSWFDDFGAKFASATGAATASAADVEGGRVNTPGARGGGGRVNQDFRFSRFDIAQKFEGDLSPDQVAVAFAKDLATLGERRMESTFSPLFGIQ